MSASVDAKLPKGKANLPKGEVELADLEAVFRALGNGSRRQILLVLHYRGGAMTSSEIAARFSCQWPTTTRHLRRLEQAGLVTVLRRGRESAYSLNRERLHSVVGQWLAVFDSARPPPEAMASGPAPPLSKSATRRR